MPRARSGGPRSLRLGLAVVQAALAWSMTTGCAKKATGPAVMSPEEREQAHQAKIAAAKKEAKSRSLIGLANGDLQTGRYMSALRRADEALAENPTNADALAVRGAALFRAGDFEGSTEALKKALEVDAKNFAAGVALGRNLAALGRHEEVIALQDKLLADDPKQTDPLIAKMWSLHALGRVDDALKVMNTLFGVLAEDDPQQPLIAAVAAYSRQLEGKGPFFVVEGETGTSDLQLDLQGGLKHSGAAIGATKGRVVFLEAREEAVIDPATVAALGLKPVGSYKPLGYEKDAPIVIIPQIAFGALTLKNVPAIVESLEPYGASLGATPSILLGRQAMLALGAITFDFPGGTLAIAKAPPTSTPAGASEVPLLLLSMYVAHAPAIPIRIDRGERPFLAYFGGTYGTSIAVTKKAYLKSGHLPREIEPPDDAEQGLKMVLVDEVQIGQTKISGIGGLVLTAEPPDAGLAQVLDTTAFELGGYVNLPVIRGFRVTYVLREGKVILEPSGRLAP